MNGSPNTAPLKRVLREIALTLDVMLGGDHRTGGHPAPKMLPGPIKPPRKPGCNQ